MVRYVPEVRSKLCTVNLVVKHTQIVYGESVPKSYQAETMNLIAIWWKIGYNSAKNYSLRNNLGAPCPGPGTFASGHVKGHI